jgi:hypothetical protein
MLAALGSGCLPCRSRSARCNALVASVQVPYASQTPEMVEDGLPRWKVGGEIAPWTAGAKPRRKWHQKWNAASGSAAYHAWTEEADTVADTPTPHQKDCWDSLYSFLQSIT